MPDQAGISGPIHFRLKPLRRHFVFWHYRCEIKCSTVKNIRNSSILLVEDDASFLRAIEKVLTNEGVVVTRASWAAEAMSQLADAQNPFDLIITDLQMPFVRASTIVKMITQRSRPEDQQPIPPGEEKTVPQETKNVFPTVPIIVMTAFGSPEIKAECFRHGISAFLDKPFRTPQLLAAVESVLASQND
jgi:CheY-like chemotaxis protein